MRFVITGAGRVGSALRERLCAEGHDVIVVDRMPGPGVVEADLRDVDSLTTLFEGAQGVFHTAGVHVLNDVPDRTFLDTNVVGTWNVCEAMCGAGVKRLVHSSTIGVYTDEYPTHIGPDSVPAAACDVYDMTKRMAELVIEHFAARDSDFHSVALRYGGIVETIEAAYDGLSNEWIALGGIVHLADVVTANVHAMSRLPLPRRAYVVAPNASSESAAFRIDASLTEEDLGMRFSAVPKTISEPGRAR